MASESLVLIFGLLLASSLLVTTMAARELAETAKEETKEAAAVKPDGYDTQYHRGGGGHYGGGGGGHYGGGGGGHYGGGGGHYGGGGGHYGGGGGHYGGGGGCHRCCYHGSCRCCATAEEAARVNALGKPQN